MTTLTPNILLDYLTGKKVSKVRKEATEQYHRMRKHANGEKLGDLITKRRPNEPGSIQQYRKDIEVEITKHPVSKVLSANKKIRRSPDWRVEYDEKAVPGYILEDQTLQAYLEEQYPVYDELDNWLFDEALTQALIDSMCLICIVPNGNSADPTALINPVAIIINCDKVIEYRHEDFAIVESPNKFKYTTPGIVQESEIYVVFTTNDIQQWVKKQDGSGYVMIGQYVHNLDELLCFIPRGQFKKNIDGQILWDTPLSPMLPHLDEAGREYSDSQAEKVLHLFSEKWEYTSNECKKCAGKGKIKGPGLGIHAFVDCDKCEGSGHMITSPFKSKTLYYNQKLPANVPTPPMGYVQKNTDITKIMKENVADHLYQALESVEMQFLAESPLNQSGKAKEWDQENTNNFVYGVASILVYIRSNVAYYINELRYADLVPDKQKRVAMVPKQEIPKKYDIVTASVLIDEYVKMNTANLSPTIRGAAQVDIAMKRFNDKPEVAIFAKLTFELDPLGGSTEDEKVIRLQNKGITEMDYVISSNIQKFVRRAMNEDQNFPTLGYEKQIEKLESYAQEVMDENSTAKQIIDTLPVNEPAIPN